MAIWWGNDVSLDIYDMFAIGKLTKLPVGNCQGCIFADSSYGCRSINCGGHSLAGSSHGARKVIQFLTSLEKYKGERLDTAIIIPALNLIDTLTVVQAHE